MRGAWCSFPLICRTPAPRCGRAAKGPATKVLPVWFARVKRIWRNRPSSVSGTRHSLDGRVRRGRLQGWRRVRSASRTTGGARPERIARRGWQRARSASRAAGGGHPDGNRLAARHATSFHKTMRVIEQLWLSCAITAEICVVSVC